MMGKRLAKRDSRPELLVSSPALRALTTAQLIADELGYRRERIVVDDRLYGSSPERLLDLVRALDDKVERGMLFGHNPEFGELAHRLSDQITEMPTCAVVEFGFDTKKWADVGTDAPVKANLEAVAKALGEDVDDITAVILDRERHADIIRECREAGARIKLIQDGDVTAAITAAIRGTNDHLAVGIGGARQTVLTAAALRCLGGALQAQFWPVSRTEIAQAREYGFEDMDKVFTLDELAPAEVVVAATGVTNGDLLRGVRYLADSARTQSLVLCTRCNWVRFVDGIHFFARERREEIRLLG